MERQEDRELDGCRTWGPTEINTKRSIVISLALGRQVNGDLAIPCVSFRANHGKIDGHELWA